MGKTLSKFKQNFIIRNYKTMSIGDMARRLKLPYITVYSRLYDQGLLDVRKNVTSDIERGVGCKILDMYIHGWYLEDIAEACHRSQQVCARVIGRVFPAAEPQHRSAVHQEPVDSYTGLTERQMRKLNTSDSWMSDITI